MKCPVCNEENNDNWPLEINDGVKEGGCQECWENQCDDNWWEYGIHLNDIKISILSDKKH